MCCGRWNLGFVGKWHYVEGPKLHYDPQNYLEIEIRNLLCARADP